MKKLFLALVLVAALAGLLLLPGVQAWLIGFTLPDYPEWPAPQIELHADDSGVIYFASSSPYDLEVILAGNDLARPTTGIGYLSMPDKITDIPVPAMIIVPGSGGISPGREQDYAALFNDNGIAAFIIDYYAPRGFDEDSNYLIRTASVTEFDLVADAYAALKLLGTSPSIDAQRIGIIGFSYGGMAARLALDSGIKRALAPDAPAFSVHIDNYGPCFGRLDSEAATGGALLTLRGTEDASNDLAACAERESELRALGVSVTAKIYEGAGHAWENTAEQYFANDAPYLAGCEVHYDSRGKASLNGEPLTDYPINADHATKMAARLTSSSRFKDCVGWGYLVGRDNSARESGYRDILAFLGTHWNLEY